MIRLIILLPTLSLFCLISGLAQPGYYPPPSSVSFHNDTLTIYPPDSLPVDPLVLLGYNIYIDNVFLDNILVDNPEDTVEYTLGYPELLPGTYEFCAKAVYNNWISEPACDTGQVMYGFDLPFYDDWSSGGFDENLWIADGNWVVNTDEGNPAPAAEFTGNPGLSDYSFSLESYPMKGVELYNGIIWLDFDVRLEALQSTGTEWLKVQVWNWTSNQWTTVKNYRNDEGSFTWSPGHINIRGITMGKIFRVRFHATGANSSAIQRWAIDNIHIYRECEGIVELELEEHWDYNRLDWWGFGGIGIDEWLHWDDGVNDNNSIGTGGAVEFDVAARWDAEQIWYFTDLIISEIAFFPAEESASYSVRLWAGEGPDTMIIDQTVNYPIIGQWNYVTLQNPVFIDVTKDLWVGYHINTPTGYPAGVDDGPAIDGYGNMMYFEGAWQTLLEIAPELDYNWNIACHISFGPPPPNPDWVYNIYRQTNIGEFEFLATTPYWYYQDSGIILEDIYCYAVTAVWNKNNDTCESPLSNTVCETIFLNNNENILKEEDIRIYPNPTNSIIHIESGEKLDEIRLFNLLGEQKLTDNPGQKHYQLNLQGLPSGIYFIVAKSKSKIQQEKIILLK